MHPCVRSAGIPARSFSLVANRSQYRSDSDAVSPRSGRQHKAWGASPRIKARMNIEPAKRAIELQIARGSNTQREPNRSIAVAVSSAVARSAGLIF
jgi:hypothetical protein